ncbi:hypothetical protein AN659_0212835 [Enterobacter sp. ST121:950178628]|nr:hypothetical protein AN659_0212835 [Enterobacter sp. ST121:950178628]
MSRRCNEFVNFPRVILQVAIRFAWYWQIGRLSNGWLMPWGEVVSNPLKAQRLAEEYRERQEAA